LAECVVEERCIVAEFLVFAEAAQLGVDTNASKVRRALVSRHSAEPDEHVVRSPARWNGSAMVSSLQQTAPSLTRSPTTSTAFSRASRLVTPLLRS